MPAWRCRACRLLDMPMPRCSPPLFDLADRAGRTVYDCMYLALAVQLGGRMVTADERLVNGLANGPWADYVIRLQDVF